MNQEDIARISALSAKARQGTLTPEEQLEREELRRRYLADVRANLRATLENTVVIGPDGKKRKLEKSPNRAKERKP